MMMIALLAPPIYAFSSAHEVRYADTARLCRFITIVTPALPSDDADGAGVLLECSMPQDTYFRARMAPHAARAGARFAMVLAVSARGFAAALTPACKEDISRVSAMAQFRDWPF